MFQTKGDYSINFRDYVLNDCQCPDCGREFKLKLHRTHSLVVKRIGTKAIIRCGHCVLASRREYVTKT